MQPFQDPNPRGITACLLPSTHKCTNVVFKGRSEDRMDTLDRGH